MKTTIEISDALLEEAKKMATLEHTTVRALIEEGLRHVLDSRKDPGEFRLRDASFRGKGLQPGVEALSWEQLRDLIYSGRGS